MFRQSAGGKNKKKKVDIVALNEKIANIARATIEENRKKNQDKEQEVNAMPEFTHKQEPKNTTFQPLVLTNDMLQKQTGNKKLKFKLKRKINIDDKMNELAPWVDKKAIANRKIMERIRELRKRQKEAKKKEEVVAVNDFEKVRKKMEENTAVFNQNIKDFLKNMNNDVSSRERKDEDLTSKEKTGDKLVTSKSNNVGIGFLLKKSDEKKEAEKLEEKLKAIREYEKQASVSNGLKEDKNGKSVDKQFSEYLQDIALQNPIKDFKLDAKHLLNEQKKMMRRNYLEDNRITLKYKKTRLVSLDIRPMNARRKIENGTPKLTLNDLAKITEVKKDNPDVSDKYSDETRSVSGVSNINLSSVSKTKAQNTEVVR